MFLLGAMALAISQLARRSPILPRWLAPLGALLAAALVTSGLGYLLLIPGLASTVYVSGVLLLIFVSATGIALRPRAAGRPVRRLAGISTIDSGTGIALAKAARTRGRERDLGTSAQVRGRLHAKDHRIHPGLS